MPSNPSWGWRKIMNLSPIVQPHIKYIIGNGQSTTLWHDNWHPLGPFIHRFGSRVTYDCNDSGYPTDSLVSQIIKDSHWHFPITQTLELNEIRSHLPTHMVSNLEQNDHCRWSLTPSGKFTISSLWDNLRVHFPVVPWYKLVWFPAHVSKCSVITWLAVLNRLYAEDRLVMFGTKAISCCSFCGGVENRDHLFFNCPYSSLVWTAITAKVFENWSSRSWSDWVALLSTLKGKSLRTIIIKLAFTVTVYNIWMERNLVVWPMNGVLHSFDIHV